MRQNIYHLIFLTCNVASCGVPKTPAKTDGTVIISSDSATAGVTSSTQPTTSSPSIGPVGKQYNKISDLPPCNTTNEGNIYFVAADNSFFVCSKTKYSKLDTKGEKGDTGTQGDKGSDGASGTKGETGSKGETGTKGDTGAAGVPAKNLTIYDANNVKIGTHVALANMDSGSGEYLIFANGGITQINMANGSFHQGLAIDQSSGKYIHDKFCFFTTTNCSSTCYLTDSTANVVPVKNSVFYTGTLWIEASGNEVDIGSLVYNSAYSEQLGGCFLVSGGVSIAHGRAITGSYTLPSGLTYPFVTPLSIIESP